MADTQFRPIGSATAPADWVIPSSLDILLKACFAHFDGSGAGGSFVPTLEIISDSGDVALEIPMDSQVAGGSSAEATWAPFLRGAQAAASGGANLSSGYANSAAVTFGPGQRIPHFNSLETNDATLYATVAGQPTYLGVATGGVYMAQTSVIFSTNGGIAYAGQFEIDCNMFDSANNPVDQLSGPAADFAELYATMANDQFEITGTCTFNADTSLTPPFHAILVMSASQSITTLGQSLLMTRLSSTPMA